MKIELCFLVLTVARALARDAITVNPGGGSSGGGSLTDLSGTSLTRFYCTSQNMECPSETIEANFAGTAFQCVARCSQRRDCLGFFYAANRLCHIRGERCTSAELVPATGSDFYRLKEGESCPSDRPQYSPPANAYTNSFCMLWGKTCIGDGYYRKPARIPTLELCLVKCSKIKTCGMVNFDAEAGTCEPLISTPCADEALVDAPSIQNFLRLPLGVTECGANRGPPSTTRPPPTEAPTEGPTEEPTEEPTEPPTEGPTEAPVPADCGGKKYMSRVFTKPGQTEVIATCNEGCAMTVCNCKKYKFCDGARFTPDGKCRVNKRTGKFAKRNKRRIFAQIKCEPLSRVETQYISTTEPNSELKCGEGWDKRNDCTFYAKSRNDKTKSMSNEGGKRCGVNKFCTRIGQCTATAVCTRRVGQPKK